MSSNESYQCREKIYILIADLANIKYSQHFLQVLSKLKAAIYILLFENNVVTM